MLQVKQISGNVSQICGRTNEGKTNTLVREILRLNLKTIFVSTEQTLMDFVNHQDFEKLSLEKFVFTNNEKEILNLLNDEDFDLLTIDVIDLIKFETNSQDFLNKLFESNKKIIYTKQRIVDISEYGLTEDE